MKKALSDELAVLSFQRDDRYFACRHQLFLALRNEELDQGNKIQKSGLTFVFGKFLINIDKVAPEFQSPSRKANAALQCLTVERTGVAKPKFHKHVANSLSRLKSLFVRIIHKAKLFNRNNSAGQSGTESTIKQ